MTVEVGGSVGRGRATAEGHQKTVGALQRRLDGLQGVDRAQPPPEEEDGDVIEEEVDAHGEESPGEAAAAGGDGDGAGAGAVQPDVEGGITDNEAGPASTPPDEAGRVAEEDAEARADDGEGHRGGDVMGVPDGLRAQEEELHAEVVKAFGDWKKRHTEVLEAHRGLLEAFGGGVGLPETADMVDARRALVDVLKESLAWVQSEAEEWVKRSEALAKERVRVLGDDGVSASLVMDKVDREKRGLKMLLQQEARYVARVAEAEEDFVWRCSEVDTAVSASNSAEDGTDEAAALRQEAEEMADRLREDMVGALVTEVEDREAVDERVRIFLADRDPGGMSVPIPARGVRGEHEMSGPGGAAGGTRGGQVASSPGRTGRRQPPPQSKQQQQHGKASQMYKYGNGLQTPRGDGGGREQDRKDGDGGGGKGVAEEGSSLTGKNQGNQSLKRGTKMPMTTPRTDQDVYRFRREAREAARKREEEVHRRAKILEEEMAERDRVRQEAAARSASERRNYMEVRRLEIEAKQRERKEQFARLQEEARAVAARKGKPMYKRIAEAAALKEEEERERRREALAERHRVFTSVDTSEIAAELGLSRPAAGVAVNKGSRGFQKIKEAEERAKREKEEEERAKLERLKKQREYGQRATKEHAPKVNVMKRAELEARLRQEKRLRDRLEFAKKSKPEDVFLEEIFSDLKPVRPGPDAIRQGKAPPPKPSVKDVLEGKYVKATRRNPAAAAAVGALRKAGSGASGGADVRKPRSYTPPTPRVLGHRDGSTPRGGGGERQQQQQQQGEFGGSEHESAPATVDEELIPEEHDDDEGQEGATAGDGAGEEEDVKAFEEEDVAEADEDENDPQAVVDEGEIPEEVEQESLVEAEPVEMRSGAVTEQEEEGGEEEVGADYVPATHLDDVPEEEFDEGEEEEPEPLEEDTLLTAEAGEEEEYEEDAFEPEPAGEAAAEVEIDAEAEAVPEAEAEAVPEAEAEAVPEAEADVEAEVVEEEAPLVDVDEGEVQQEQEQQPPPQAVEADAGA